MITPILSFRRINKFLCSLFFILAAFWGLPAAAIQTSYAIDSSCQTYPLETSYQTIKERLSIGFTTACIWIKIDLDADDVSNKSILQVKSNHPAYVELWDEGNVLRIHADTPPSQRQLGYRLYAFPIAASLQPKTVFLKVKGRGALSLPIEHSSFDMFIKKKQKEYFLYALYFGGTSVLILLSLFFLIAFKEKTFLFYMGFGFSLQLLLLAQTGIGFQFFWFEYPRLSDLLPQFVSLTGIFFGLLFVKYFLELSNNAPKINQFFNFLIFISVLQIFLSTLPVENYQSSLLMTLTSLMASSLIIFTLAFAVIKRWEINKIFFLAWSTLLISAVVTALKNLGFLKANLWTDHALFFGSFFELLLLAVVLVQRLLLQKEEAYRLQRELISTQQKLVKTLQNQELKLEEKVKSRTSRLEEMVVEKMTLLSEFKRFANFLAHDFRNPLGIIRNQVYLLKKDSDNQKNSKRLLSIENAAKRLVWLFDEWLESHRIINSTELALVEVNLYEFIEEIKESQNLEYRSKIKLIFPSKRDQYNHSFLMDPLLIRMALLNLLENAFKYAAHSKHFEIGYRFDNDKQVLHLFVRDFGDGIARDAQQRIFMEYIREPSALSQDGLGLGLAFVKKIAELHQGKLELESAPGRGSCFAICLPFSKPLDSVAPSAG